MSSPLPHPLAMGGSCPWRSLRSRVWTGRPVPVPGEGVLGGLPSGLCPGVSLAVFSGVASARADLGPPEGLGVAWHVSSVFLPEPSPCSGEGWGETGSRGGDQVAVACRLPDSPLLSLQARPSWAALWPAGWGPRPHPMGARCPCPLISPSGPPPPATCPWCSCGPRTPTKVRSVPGGWAAGCQAAGCPQHFSGLPTPFHSHPCPCGWWDPVISLMLGLQMLSAPSRHRHRAFARAVPSACSPPPHPTGCPLLVLQGSAPPPRFSLSHL